MAEIMRKEFVFFLTGLIAVIMFIDFFLNIPSISSVASTIRSWAVVISAMALAIGAVQLIRFHGTVVTKRTAGKWRYSLWLIVSFAIALLFGLTNINNPTQNVVYNWIFSNVYTSLSTTIYAITGFYIFSAAYRAFRARTFEAALLLISGCIVMLTNAPIGSVIWVGIPVMGQWLLNYGQVPATRAFLMVTAFGIIFYGFKVLIGKERGYYGTSEGTTGGS